MVKATLKGAVLLGLLAMALPAFAEVQNVRVGGDVTVRGFHRENLDLRDGDGALDAEDDFFTNTVGVNVGADLTENVQAFVRMVNEQTWGVETSGSDTSQLALSQGWVRLNEFAYTPLSFVVGRQPVVWGRGMVLGSSLIPGTIGRGGDRIGDLTPDEWTDFTAFDGVRAIADLSGMSAVSLPVTLDLVYLKLDENNIGLPDDITLQGVNVGTKLEDDMSSEIEAYFLNKRDKSANATSEAGVVAPNASAGGQGSISTLGLRGSVQPVEGSLFWGEAAYQFGRKGLDANLQIPSGSEHQAWMFTLGGEYTLADVALTPKLGAEWIFYSGKDLDGAVGGWDPIARGYFTTALREFQATGFYPPDQLCFNEGVAGQPCTGSATNQHQLSFYGSVKPIEDLTVYQRYSWFFTDTRVIPSGTTAATTHGERESYAGFEWDTKLTYDYTEDVQLGLLYALFAPGSIYRNIDGVSDNDTAQEVITHVSVKF